MKTKFVILTYGRTGSSYLCDLLNSHSKIDCLYEIIKNVKNPNKLSPLALVDQEINKSKASVVGFKLLENQGDDELLDYLLTDNDIKVIFLKRKNYLARFCSFKMAQETGVWHHDNQINKDIFIRGIIDIFKFKYTPLQILKRLSTAVKSLFDKNNEEEIKLKLTKEEVLEDFKQVTQYENKIEKKLDPARSITIYYEDLIYNQRNTIISLLELLGLKEENLMSSRSKIEWLSLSERISNFDELKDSIKDTDYPFIEIN